MISTDMLEALGYELYFEHDTTIQRAEWVNRDSNYAVDQRIYFDHDFETYSIDDTANHEHDHGISVELNKAISQYILDYKWGVK